MENNLGEEEIVDKLWDLLHLNTYLDLNNEMKEKCEIPREVLKRWFENSKSLLDLYNKEKEKNKIIADDIEKFKLEAYILGKTEENETMKGIIKRHYIGKDKIREFALSESQADTYHFKTVSLDRLLKFLEEE